MVDLVAGALGMLPSKLLELLNHEYKLQKGLGAEIQSLSRELESVHAALLKVAAVPWDQLDEQIKLWAREVREASYDMDDVLDSFLVRVEGCDDHVHQSRLKSALKKMGRVFKKGKARRGIAGAIEDIKKQLQEVADRRARYKVDEIVAKPAPKSSIDPRLEAMYKEVKQLIGIDKSMGELISMLTPSQEGDDVSDNKIMKMVSVVGVGGLGKTTLAKASYDKLRSQYDCGAFVSVGRNPDLVNVFKDILFDLDKNKYQNIHNTGRGIYQLIHELREFLRNKRYFIVIDDIWEPQSWETIKLAFVENNRGNRIIATSRKFDVAIEAVEVYKLQPLSYDNSKRLFYTRIFGDAEKRLPNHLDDTANIILRKCDGIPLAIITMGSLLVGKPVGEWSELCSALGFGHVDNRHVENTMRILSLSYYDLPSHLRTCLLYLSAFPEDYIIDKNSLIWKWIAEGFVHEKQGKWLFEVGEGYFNDLINRSMIQAVEDRWDGIVHGCRVHDMILDLIRSLSGEENFFAILDNSEDTLSRSNVRRLSNQNSTLQHITTHANRMEMPQVRSYIVWCDINQPVPNLSFKLLRVLALENCQHMEDCHLENLGDLLHLRYLKLTGPGISGLPKQIGNLKFLQTLDVGKVALEELPSSIVLLPQLVCLLCTHWFRSTRLPDGFGKLTSLEELRISAVGYDKCKHGRVVKELGSLVELRVLNAKIDQMDESVQRDLVESLHNLHKIQDLIIKKENKVTDADVATWEAAGFELPQHLRRLSLSGVRFSRLPSSCINPSRLHSLLYLDLCLDSMDEQDLRLLGMFTELHYLNLGTSSTLTVDNINAADGYFQKLRWFTLPYAMVQFQRSNEDESRISLHIWGGMCAMPFGSSKNYHCTSVPSAVMPNLEVLSFKIPDARLFLDGNGDCRNIGWEYLASLREVSVDIYPGMTLPWLVTELEDALRNAIKVHPNRPKIEVDTWWED
ncbi:putative disease resistance protein [Dichanthelium oligosanthes]|uniref:Putative disease resistance protein n=1 Tax=Dichanthelium oligosanthes TaxID=888268 RepID=A0A1E5UNW0_9POAL|nr:putative disease resistance protein [Dichanthelium oligosanthes]